MGSRKGGRGGRKQRRRLLAQVERMVAHSDHPDAAHFDAREWLDQWMNTPQRGLGWKCPSSEIRRPGGLARLQNLLEMSVSGAYA